MNDEKNYEIANLTAHDSVEIANLEKKIQLTTGENIVLIAYQAKQNGDQTLH